MLMKHLLNIHLDLFDGSAAGGGEAGAAAPAPDGGSVSGETKATRGSARRGKSGEFQNVLYGKQSPAAAGDAGGEGQQQPSDAGSGNSKQGEAAQQTPQADKPATLEDRRKAYFDLVNGEYKDIYTEDTQNIINDRFKQAKAAERQIARQQPLIDMLMERYKIGDGDIRKLTSAIEGDDALWTQAAEEAGMTTEQLRKFHRLQRENLELAREREAWKTRQFVQQQNQKWDREAEEVRKTYPSFDLGRESQNKDFGDMIKLGVSMQKAYEVVHMDEIKAAVAKAQAKAVEKQLTDNIRTKGARPQENGTTAQSGFIVKNDVSKLTKADLAEIRRRTARGEKIAF